MQVTRTRKPRMRWIVTIRGGWLLLGLISFATAYLAQDVAELEVDHNANSQFITPHTAWATP